MPLFGKKKKEEAGPLCYVTTEGVSFGEKNPVEEEIRKRYIAEGKTANRTKILDDVKNERKIPKEVEYMGKSLTIQAPSIDKALEIIRNNKNVLEENYGVKISDSVKLKEF